MNDMDDEKTMPTQKHVPVVSGVRPPKPFSSLVDVDACGFSHPGKVRPNNEDHYLIASVGRYLQVEQSNLPEGELSSRAEETCHAMVVADGMGGYAGGEVASRIAIASLVNLVLHVPDWIMCINDDHARTTMQRTEERYREINDLLLKQAEAHPHLGQMGTTMTLAYSLGKDLFIAHVGDSRAYLLRDKSLRQLTRDQTLAQAYVDMGEMSRAEAATFRLRHVLTSALGRPSEELKIEVRRFQLRDGDILLLCTDGLTDMVPDPQIANVLGWMGDAETACKGLVNLALERGGKDNVTVAVVRYHLPPSTRA